MDADTPHDDGGLNFVRFGFDQLFPTFRAVLAQLEDRTVAGVILERVAAVEASMRETDRLMKEITELLKAHLGGR